MDKEKEGMISNAINKVVLILRKGGGPFWRFIFLVIIAGALTIGGISAFKGCSIQTKNNTIKVQSRPIK